MASFVKSDLESAYPYGLKINPFSLAVPVPGMEIARVLGGRLRKLIRDEILHDLENRRNEFRIFTIQGKPQTGKTQLLLNIAYNIRTRKDLLKYIKFNYLKMSIEKDLNILKHYQKLSDIIAFLRKKRYVLMVDEIDTVYKEELFWKSLKSLIDKRPKNLTLILAITPEVLTGIEKISAPLASRIRSSHLFYDLSELSLPEIEDIVLEYLIVFGAKIDEKNKKVLCQGVEFIYKDLKLNEPRDILAVLEKVLEIAREKREREVTLEDFRDAIQKIRPHTLVEGSLIGLKQYEYLMALTKLPPKCPPQNATHIITKSLILILKKAIGYGFIKYTYPKGRKIKTLGGEKEFRIVDVFVTTRDNENVALDVKVKEHDGDLLGEQELKNVIDVAEYSKDVDRVIVISNGTFPYVTIPKLVLNQVNKVFLADLIIAGEKIEYGYSESVQKEVIESILREIKIIV